MKPAGARSSPHFKSEPEEFGRAGSARQGWQAQPVLHKIAAAFDPLPLSQVFHQCLERRQPLTQVCILSREMLILFLQGSQVVTLLC